MFIINSHLLQYNNFSSSKHDKEFCWYTTCYGLNFKTEETSLSTFSRYDCCSRFYACYYFIHSFFCRRKWATAPDNYIFVSFYKHRWWFYIWLVVKIPVVDKYVPNPCELSIVYYYVFQFETSIFSIFVSQCKENAQSSENRNKLHF